MAVPRIVWWLGGLGLVGLGAAVIGGGEGGGELDLVDLDAVSRAKLDTDAQGLDDDGVWTKGVVEARYATRWILGEGPKQASQVAEIAGAVLGAAGTALAPVAGPIASAAMATIGNIIASIKKRDRWVTSPAGEWAVIATLPYAPAYVDVQVQWSRPPFNVAGIRRFAGSLKNDGLLPAPQTTSLCASDADGRDPSCDYVFDGQKSVAKNARWIEPPGPRMPEIAVVVTQGQTVVQLWIPSRGADAPYDSYLYRCSWAARRA